jgi:hypothetical protein
MRLRLKDSGFSVLNPAFLFKTGGWRLSASPAGVIKLEYFKVLLNNKLPGHSSQAKSFGFS